MEEGGKEGRFNCKVRWKESLRKKGRGGRKGRKKGEGGRKEGREGGRGVTLASTRGLELPYSVHPPNEGLLPAYKGRKEGNGRKEGRLKGRTEGRKEGRTVGRKEGWKIGRMEG